LVHTPWGAIARYYLERKVGRPCHSDWWEMTSKKVICGKERVGYGAIKS
jgi:hypothetical protein